MQTKITELLSKNNISFRLLPCSKPVFTCEEAAQQRGISINEMIKCILLVDKDKKYFLACLQGDKQLDPNKVRELVECKRLSFASKQEISEILGYEMGAVPPLLLRNQIQIIFDDEIKRLEKCNISSGDPIFGLELKASDLISLVKPLFGSIAK